jgi:FkbM family methyltransferase
MCVALSKHAARHVYFHDQYETVVSQLVREVVRPGQKWHDVRANVGYYSSLIVQLLGGNGAVWAVESNPNDVRFLEETVCRMELGNFHVFTKAVSDTSGETVLLQVPKSNSAQVSAIPHHHLKDLTSILMLTTRLDDFIEANGIEVDFTKIGVERLGELAFAEMRRTLRTCPPKAIFSDITHFYSALVRPTALIELIASYGYVPFKIREEGLIPYRSGDILDALADKDMIFVQSDNTSIAAHRVVS